MALEANGDGLLGKLFDMALGVVGGAFVTFITIRTKMAMLDRDISELKHDQNTAVKTFDERLIDIQETADARFRRMERRESMMLRMLVDISQKMGTTQRFPDDMIAILMDAPEH